MFFLGPAARWIADLADELDGTRGRLLTGY